MSESERHPITAERVLEVLSRHIGAAQGLHVDELVFALTATASNAHLERQVRTVVTALRLQGQHICGHPRSGYYIAATPEDLDATCEFLLERAMTGLSQVAAMRRVSLPDLRGQLRLPT
jgi:hypothetical protein